jgi:hypothetical protein
VEEKEGSLAASPAEPVHVGPRKGGRTSSRGQGPAGDDVRAGAGGRDLAGLQHRGRPCLLWRRGGMSDYRCRHKGLSPVAAARSVGPPIRPVLVGCLPAPAAGKMRCRLADARRVYHRPQLPGRLSWHGQFWTSPCGSVASAESAAHGPPSGLRATHHRVPRQTSNGGTTEAPMRVAKATSQPCNRRCKARCLVTQDCRSMLCPREAKACDLSTKSC